MRTFFMAMVSVALGCGQVAHAWSGAGHMVIAAGAYRQLPAATRAKVDEVLKSHPNYEGWRAAFEPGAGNLDLALFVFMRASTWPDEIRRKGKGYDHPHWHYINYPLKPPSFAMEAGPSPEDDILYGIEQSERAVGDRGRSAVERAVYLAWLVHLIGDLHQPLHCSALVNETYPSGDKGGNDFYVMPASRGIKLHSLWDGLLGTRNNPRSRVNDASLIVAGHPRKSLPELKRATVKEWSLEGRAIAIEQAYLRGKLSGSKSAESAQALPEGYTKAAKVVAERQAALAVYRLADEVERWVR